MQINLVNNQSPAFGHLNLSKSAKAILSESISGSDFEAKRLKHTIDYATKNNKINVDVYVNDDNRTLFACFVETKGNNIINRRTENFFTRLVQGPVEFLNKMVIKAEEYAKGI
jgi:hypothetical protein